MESTMHALYSLLTFFFLLSTTVKGSQNSQLKTYIVHVAHTQNASFNKQTYYRSFLPGESRLIHSYNHVVSGFAARLSEEELNEISKKDGFIHAHPDRQYSLHTTHTPSFLGLNLPTGLFPSYNLGAGVIVGLLDTGITPNHPSYSGDGMPPPPSKWKGRCEFNGSVCNNKLIGARFFLSAAVAENPGANITMSPIDQVGHGTHTSATAGGAFVPNAQVLGQAGGIARGIAPLAHIAMYRVCSLDNCAGADMLAGLDAAIDDGVDIVSASIGGISVPFFEDFLAIGSFRAMEKGVLVSCSAGNDGPIASTLSNEAPWILTVAASTHDRSIKVGVNLVNGCKLNDGQSLFQPQVQTLSLLPLVYAGASRNPDAAFCGNGSLENMDIKGKVVLCERGGGISRIGKGVTVATAGGVGMILMNQAPDGFSTLADPHVLPAAHVSYEDGLKVKAYINSTTNPWMTFSFKGTVFGTTPSPAITSFSSRGPSLASPGILKPDITGPGVNILAAWPVPVGPDSIASNFAGITFNMISGTSMSAPHISGVAALIKSAHPDWSPAAIKSAIMTTAEVFDRKGKPIMNEQNQPADLFAVGAGHVNPLKAIDPGLVYDLQPNDYIPYICGLGYNSTQVTMIARHPIDCSYVQSITGSELNYPSISVIFNSSTYVVVLERTVKNVGEANSKYMVEVDTPANVVVVVEPKVLQFYKVNEEKKFKVYIFRKINGGGNGTASQGYLKWISENRIVRSPISVIFN